MTPSAVSEDDESPTLPGRRGRGRRTLLRSAASVLACHGYAGASLSAIATDSRMSMTAVYHYWSSRDDLVEEVVSVGQGETFRRVRAALRASSDDVSPVDRILVAAEEHLEAVMENLDFARAAARGLAALPAERQHSHREAVKAYEELWRALIDDLHHSGGLSGDLESDVAVKLVLGVLNSVPEFRTSRSGAVVELVATARRFLRNGLRPGGVSRRPDDPSEQRRRTLPPRPGVSVDTFT